jgi:predicted PurR-regulated permease PerM
VVLALVVAAGLTLIPFWAPLVLAAWVALLARPLLARTARLTRGRHRAAGALVVALVLLLFVPLAAALLSLSSGAVELGQSVARSSGTRSALIAVVSGSEPTGGEALGVLMSPRRLLGLLKEHGAQAMSLLSGIAGVATEAALGLFVFIYAVYVFLVDGASMYAWVEDHAPLEIEHTRRLAAAFRETGRGLLVGVGLTGLTQGLVATAAYVALGVPRAFVLGLLTCIASLLPSIGTGLVWLPIAAGLALAGKTAAAVILALVGLLVIGTVDNVLRPFFARFGRLELSSFLLLTSMFGGLALVGAWGLLLGPLAARLAKEALVLAREERLRDERAATGAARDAVRPAPSPPSAARGQLAQAKSASDSSTASSPSA